MLWLMSTGLKPHQKAPCRASRPFSISGSARPSFHSLSEASSMRCPAPWKSRPQGLATLSTVSLAFAQPWKPLSAPNAPGLLPSKLSSNLVIERAVSNPSSALALFPQTSRLVAGASTASSHMASCAPVAPRFLLQVGAYAPLGLLASWALPPSTMSFSLSLKDSPRILQPTRGYPHVDPGSQGLPRTWLGSLPS